jgi:hypothetical protein
MRKRWFVLGALLVLVAGGVAAQQTSREFDNNLLFRPLNPKVFSDGSTLFQNKSGTKTYGLRLLEGSPATVTTCGTAAVTGLDGLMQVVISGGTPSSCLLKFGGSSNYTNPVMCFYSDQTSANAAGGLVIASTGGVRINIPTFTGAAANFGTDTLNILCIGQK